MSRRSGMRCGLLRLLRARNRRAVVYLSLLCRCTRLFEVVLTLYCKLG